MAFATNRLFAGTYYAGLMQGIGKYTKKGTQICFRTIENRIAELRKRLPDSARLLRRELRLYPAPEGKEKFPGIKNPSDDGANQKRQHRRQNPQSHF